MRHAATCALIAACSMMIGAVPAAKAAEPVQQAVKPQTAPNPPPPDEGEDYRPPWVDPDAKPPDAGIDEDPTPFNPSDVDGKSVLDNN